jgi:hypothetical protein
MTRKMIGWPEPVETDMFWRKSDTQNTGALPAIGLVGFNEFVGNVSVKRVAALAPSEQGVMTYLVNDELCDFDARTTSCWNSSSG